MDEYKQISDLDIFFYYGEKGSNLDLEIKSDIMSGMLQPKRTLFYNRSEGCGIADKENYPNAIMLTIMGRYDIVNWNAERNALVSDGTDNYPDRRVAISQNSVEFEQNKNGFLGVNVTYIPFKDYQNPQNVSMPITKGT